MRVYRIEVFADSRTVILPQDRVKATSFRTAAGRAVYMAKGKTKRGTKQLTVRLTDLGEVDKEEFVLSHGIE